MRWKRSSALPPFGCLRSMTCSPASWWQRLTINIRSICSTSTIFRQSKNSRPGSSLPSRPFLSAMFGLSGCCSPECKKDVPSAPTWVPFPLPTLPQAACHDAGQVMFVQK